MPIRVVYLDRSLAPGGGGGGGGGDVQVDKHDFVPEGCPPPGSPRVHLLYRPGHYVSRAAGRGGGAAGGLVGEAGRGEGQCG